MIVTGRHRQIDKWTRETYTDMKHYYDAWHVAKGKMILVHKGSVCSSNKYKPMEED